jgi:hypothetical protein
MTPLAQGAMRAVIALGLAAFPAGTAACARAVEGTQMAETLEKRLVGTWRHSHEDDTDTEMVFRPDTFEFPPSRGRVGYSFRADGTCTYIGIAARDGAAREACTWTLRRGTQPAVVVTLPGGREEVLPIVSVSRERLVVANPRR